MSERQRWIEAIKKLPAWVSGAISLATAIIGFVLFLQGNSQLGVTILGILFVVVLFLLFMYVAFAKTPPLIEGGKGIYRFEKYRTWALIGIGFVIGLTSAVLILKPSRSFVASAITGRATPTDVAIQSSSDESAYGSTATRATGTSTFVSPCFEQYFSDIPADRISTIERGFESYTMLDTNQSKDGVVGIQLTEFNQSLGAIRVFPFPPNNFKIESIVNAQCQQVEEYFHADDGIDRDALFNGDEVHIWFGENEYSFSLSFSHPDPEYVRGTFLLVSP